MPVVEYRRRVPGGGWPYARGVEPGVAGAARAPRARRTCCSSSWTTRGSASSAAIGSPIETPNLDGLAANGLRFNNMHTTALCSPSRSCIITGRNHHSNAMACITELATGYPGYNGVVPFENGFISEMLLAHGYNTYMVGKWHLTPSRPGDGRGAVRPVAARPRLRAVLRVPRR